MKQLLLQYAMFNSWANKKIAETVLTLSKDQQQQLIISSFDSVFSTMLHLIDAEGMWWQRLKLVEQVERPGLALVNADMVDVVQVLQRSSDLWEDWVRNANEVALTHVFAYQNTKKELFKQPVNEVLMHIFNHQSYHRGQIVTMLRQLGVKKIPATDFIVYTRLKK